MATDHLTKAKEYIAKGDDYHRKAAEEIVAAMEEDPTLSHRAIADQIGKSPRWVGHLVRSFTSAQGLPDNDSFKVEWGTEKPATTAKKVAREDPQAIAEAIKEAPESARRKIAKAIAKDRSTSREVYEAISENVTERTEGAETRARKRRPGLYALSDELDASVGLMKARKILMHEVLPALEKLDVSDQERRESLLDDLTEVENAIGWVRSVLESDAGSFDQQLAAILEERS
jgi:hypothetical protein